MKVTTTGRQHIQEPLNPNGRYYEGLGSSWRLRHRLAWFGGRGCFDSLFAAIFSRIFQPRREGVQALGPLLREGLGLGCASHAVCCALGTVGSVCNALD